MENRNDGFDRYYREFSNRLYKVAFRMVNNQQDALDIVQDSFYKAYKNRDKFHGNSAISTWLYRIVVNQSFDFLRKRLHNRKVEIDKVVLKSKNRSAEKELMNKDMVGILKKEIDVLPPRQKTIFILKTYEEFTYKEIAVITRSRIGTVKATYHQTVQKLKRISKEKGILKNGLQNI
jgi:RNA polymerase sigma-70 factor, ECF subfamily